MSNDVEIVHTAGATVAVTRFHVRAADLPEIGDRMGQAFSEVTTGLGRLHVVPTGPAIACYETRTDGFDVAAGFQVPSTFTGTPEAERLDLPPVDAAHTTHLGSYSRLSEAYQRLQDATREGRRELATTTPMWEEYWSEPGTPDSETRTEVYWPLQGS